MIKCRADLFRRAIEADEACHQHQSDFGFLAERFISHDQRLRTRLADSLKKTASVFEPISCVLLAEVIDALIREGMSFGISLMEMVVAHQRAGGASQQPNTAIHERAPRPMSLVKQMTWVWPREFPLIASIDIGNDVVGMNRQLGRRFVSRLLQYKVGEKHAEPGITGARVRRDRNRPFIDSR